MYTVCNYVVPSSMCNKILWGQTYLSQRYEHKSFLLSNVMSQESEFFGLFSNTLLWCYGNTTVLLSNSRYYLVNKSNSTIFYSRTSHRLPCMNLLNLRRTSEIKDGNSISISFLTEYSCSGTDLQLVQAYRLTVLFWRVSFLKRRRPLVLIEAIDQTHKRKWPKMKLRMKTYGLLYWW